MGASTTSMRLDSREEAELNYKESNFWMENLAGNHLIVDVALVHGAVVWSSKSVKYRNGLDYWHVNVQDETSYDQMLDVKILKHFSKFTGYLSFELIGSVITEIHLALNERLVSFYGKRWLNSIVSLYEKQKWYSVDTTSAGYSAKFDCGEKDYTHEDVTEGTTNVLQVPGAIIINGNDLESINAKKELLLAA